MLSEWTNKMTPTEAPYYKRLVLFRFSTQHSICGLVLDPKVVYPICFHSHIYRGGD
jgi:hypothetical protein